MNSLLYFFGSGLAFFAGASLVLTAVALASSTSRKWLSRVAILSGLIGFIFITASATPLPYWFYGSAGVISLTWLSAERSKKPAVLARRHWFRAFVVGAWFTGAMVELPYHLTPSLMPAGHPELYVFGDSITAGIEGGTETWPQLLSRSHTVEVHDHSRVGATAESAVRTVEKVTLGDGIILVEIGGNDLLGNTTVTEFDRNLDQLLSRLSGAGRTVIMFELPLPPFCNEFGRVQRRLAAVHHVLLLPKRFFISVLTTPQATVDSLHLSPLGHERMAEMVWQVIRPAYADTPNVSRRSAVR